MPDWRPEPPIEVFGVDEVAWTHPEPRDPTASALTGSGLPGPPTSSAERDAVVDEIHQGDQTARSGFGQRRSAAEPFRISLAGGLSVAPSQLAAGVAGLLVIAFLAGLTIGRDADSGPRDAGAAPLPSSSTTVNPGTAPSSILPTEPSVTIGVAVPNPVPGGTGGPTGQVAGPDVYALQLAANPSTQPGQNLERRDAGALAGPWSLIVRRSDGSLGQHSSVVTFPVTPADDARTRTGIDVGAVGGYDDGLGGIVWPIAGKFARIRGDLGRTMLAKIAGQVSIRRARPVMDHPPTRFRVVAAEPYRAPVVAESRYDSLRLSSGPIGALVFTDVLRCASFEEALFAEGFGRSANIGGHPAVLSSVGGGNAALAWEPAPGSIALVGFSGYLDAPASRTSLVDLARGGRLLDRRQWEATHPYIVKNTNVYY